MYSDPALPRSPAPARRGPVEKLRSALLELGEGKARILTHEERDWASITFAGTRHRLELEFAGVEGVEAGESFIAFLPEHEFAIPGQLVADAAVIEVDHRMDPPCLRIMCELLLLEDR
ncbi:hypothetical protein FHS61_002482 [Altererythrobacter atlanticus]|uniref:Uncharacterized protein n=1 Tax=Croceibacterium atlanticum TaxID=1267766 RepID=A0A0F7KT73_9SPHN|nr:hypothetical protein [Croceibacterium atlanticum]AKH41985.1 hypothetical protein WYH_00937 [Croceibacterium atlanticum]MBB5733447.1 hypothetical protein [Croceibacterium atlanticum]